MHTNSYNPQRQLLLIKRQLTVFQKPLLTVLTFGLLALFAPTLIRAIFEPHELSGLMSSYMVGFYIGGLVLTSMVFKELHSPHKSYFYLMLPASTVEKLVGAWLLTSPLYSLTYLLTTLIVYLIGHLIAGEPFIISSFFNEGMAGVVVAYMIIQSIFLWGALYFRKNNFLKTILALLGLGICLAIFSAIMLKLLIGETMLIFHSEGPMAPGMLPSNFLETYIEVFIYALAPYMLLTAYFTLKERQL